jgi:hypothetical protein
MRTFPVIIRQIGTDGDNNAFFPSPGGGKIVTAADGRTLVTYATGAGSAILAFDGEKWERGDLVPIARPYLVQDSAGFLHLFGLHAEHRGQEVWHFQSREPHSFQFDAGERVYAKNYSAATVDADDTLYYFGAGLEAFGFRKKRRGGGWSPTVNLASGPYIYPGVVCEGSTLHLLCCGWNNRSALYEGVYYIRSEDRGASWQASDGTPLDLPVVWNSGHLETLTATQRIGIGEANTHDLCLTVDRDGVAHVLYWYTRPYCIAFGTASGGQPEANIHVKHARLGAEGWQYSDLCEDPERDVAYAVMTQAESSRLYVVLTHKQTTAGFYDLGCAFSDDSGAHWSPIQPITDDANERRLSYAHPAISRQIQGGKVRFVCNMWSGKNPSPVYYGEIDISGEQQGTCCLREES